MSQISLIGNGFVGKNLLDFYNKKVKNIYDSKNIEEISKKQHEWIFCAAPSAKKWIANKNPDQDRKNCEFLASKIINIPCERIVLFSTIDVYNLDCHNDEKTNSYSEDPYGKNRKLVEDILINSSKTKKLHIFRLPALYGKYLEKNYLYDLINNNCVSNVKINSQFQWLNIELIKEHIEDISLENFTIKNLVPEPIKTQEIIDIFFPNIVDQLDYDNEGTKYDKKTIYTDSGYICNKKQTINGIKSFIQNDRNYNK